MNLDIPFCKYGADCYRQNPDHLKNFRHSGRAQKKIKVKESEENFENETIKKKNNVSKPQAGETNKTDGKTDKLDQISNMSSVSEWKFAETVKHVLDNMPKDFFDFWKFCSSINKLKPEDSFAEMGFHLVGVYDILSKKLPDNKSILLHRHWRFYYDPPEFQTVVIKDGKDLHHIGYFRDNPCELPSVLASNSATTGPKLTVMGDNIFAAMNAELTETIRKSKDKKLITKFKGIQDQLRKFASKEKYCLDIQSPKVKARNKKVNSKTFHGLGIVVPVVKDVGYRPLPDSDATIKNFLKKIISAEDEDSRLEEEESLDDLISNVQFANDECDYGMGLELGIDLFCFGDPYFHNHISHLLPLAYSLLKRHKYAEIVKAHLMNRKMTGDLSELVF